ncbi:MAG TPA: hypothetical protein VK455_04760 [Thermoplasmata archaeon]|nr:hypothetical protein [Thermoplasmata archaeon]
MSGLSSPEGGPRLLAILTLRRTRAVVRSRGGRLVVAGIALAYAFIALLAGYMLEFARTGASGVSAEVLTNRYSPAWWNYPAVLVVAPGGVLALPFLATVAMVVVSMGVGLGMGAGLILAVRFVRSWRTVKASGGTGSPLAGLTPAMVAVLTLGACCSTSAAAAGGIGAIAEASGTTYNQILLNSWYLNVFQVAVLGLALIAQEQLIAVYGNLLGTSAETPRRVPNATRRAASRVGAPVHALRLFLVIAGTLWTLSLLVELAAPSAGAPIAGRVFGEIYQHGFIGVAAIAAGLLPGVLRGAVAQPRLHRFVRVGRALLLVGGASIAVGVPPPVCGWGVYGLGNEVLGAGGIPASLGGILPPGGIGPSTDVVIAAVYATLGVVTMLLALYPGDVLRRLAGDERMPTSVPAEGTAESSERRGPVGRPEPVDTA